ncbi:hypothetical protein F5884DRAFT_241560 [Xylogone sp. PMI_703]|nr:hypothetical protein F5884DRAFT_241560 [Xylogone sp. PMI_703]
MEPPVTEVVVLPLQSEDNVDQAIRALSDILPRQPGFRKFRWGQWKESSDKLQLLVDWDNLESHKAFENSGADFSELGTRLWAVLAAPPLIHHVTWPSSIIDANIKDSVIELATFYDISEAFESDLGEFLQVLSKSNGFKAFVEGHILEELQYETVETPVKAYQLAIAWESVDHHINAMKTKEVTESLPKVGGASKHVEMHHVAFTEA